MELPVRSVSLTSLDLEIPENDFDGYIPLGTLHMDNDFGHGFCSNQPCSSGSKWHRLRDTGVRHHVNLLEKDLLYLIKTLWIRAACRHHPSGTVMRIYLLPHDKEWHKIMSNDPRKAALRRLLHSVDVSSDSWAGKISSNCEFFDPWASAEEGSLFYLFNKLPSPAPDPTIIKDRNGAVAVERVLDTSSSPEPGADLPLYGSPTYGLKTRLYPYQARSSAVMIQKETAPRSELDPRLEERQSPDGSIYYYSPRETLFFKTPDKYEAPRGGILAESMGLGKTLICLATILATHHQRPKVPPLYQRLPVRERVGSLLSMAASAVARHGIPYETEFRREGHELGISYPHLKSLLEGCTQHYDMEIKALRTGRGNKEAPKRRFLMHNGTLIVVPRHLLHQWQSEIRKHLIEGTLKVLVIDSESKKRKAATATDCRDIDFSHTVPPDTLLLKYDIVLFSRSRFEQEIKDGSDEHGRRQTGGISRSCRCEYIGATRKPNCKCFQQSQVYQSPLKKLHWLRMIIDEGHSFSSKNSNAVLLAMDIQVERRWVVSGTPVKDLVGVEVDLSTAKAGDVDPSVSREMAIESRRNFSTKDDEAVKSLGSLATNFLKVHPWCDEPSAWDDYVYRHEHYSKRTHTAYSACFPSVLRGLVVKTRPEDVEKDILLPPMSHTVVTLEPCWFDKMTANLFVQVLRANEITSERIGVDYLFHPNSARARQALVKNLRQSAFTWTGFSVEDVVSTMQTTAKYLGKADKSCSAEDIKRLMESQQAISELQNHSGWAALSRLHEVGMLVQDWPEEYEDIFALDYPSKPTMVGLTPLLDAQSHVDARITSEHPFEDIEIIGAEVRAKLATKAEQKESMKEELDSLEAKQTKRGVPSSFVAQNSSRRASTQASKPSPSKARPGNSGADSNSASNGQSPRKRPLLSSSEVAELPSDSSLRRPRLVGTTSAKLTYLLGKVMRHQEKEKIIIFYDGNDAAYYIAQGLEILHVNHRIYARTLDNATRSKYVALFNENPEVRVLLIDVACGALGLNLNAASRVLITNPIHRPDLEAQAIKRAHRIGQTREVFVETLVLKGSIEEAIHHRAKHMSYDEHRQAKLLEDDAGIRSIIQNASILQISDCEKVPANQFAPLDVPEQLFGRPERIKYHKFRLEKVRIRKDATVGAAGMANMERPKKKVKV